MKGFKKPLKALTLAVATAVVMSCFSVAAFVSAAGSCDVSVSEAALKAASVYDGDYVKLTATLRNMGDEAVPAGVTVLFTVGGKKVEELKTAKEIAPGGKLAVVTSGYWKGIFGSRILKVYVNSAKTVAETDYANNVLATRVSVIDDVNPNPPTTTKPTATEPVIQPTTLPTSKPSDEKPDGKGKLHDVTAADLYEIPKVDNNINNIGAVMPYVTYDTEDATVGGGASVVTSPNFDTKNIASQASGQAYVKLPKSGSYAEWTMKSTGAGVTMRFTMPDTSDGMGQDGSLDVYVNGKKVKTVDLTSYFMWQYFSGGNPNDAPDGGVGCFAFDEVHFILDTPLKSGDKIRIQSSGAKGLEYGVDFIEVEEVPAAIGQPVDSLSVTDPKYGAVPNDGKDDLAAFEACIKDADKQGLDVYIPAGTYELNQIWKIHASNMMITGAGIWYTNIKFTNPNRQSGGISGGNDNNGSNNGNGPNDGYCKNIEFCNMYINSSLRSRYGQEAVYKCFMDVFTDGSAIHDIWEDHFECGFWIGDYNGKHDYSDGLKIFNSRIRNNFADGVNFCMGTSNAAVFNCSVRNNGDDGLAMWNDDKRSSKDETNNIFCYNTIDYIWRAGAIAIYGGDGHQIYNNYIKDTFMAGGIHLNTTFSGFKFDNNKGITFSNNILVCAGTRADGFREDVAAVDVKQEVKNITFNNTYIYNAQHDALRFWDNPTGLTFNNTTVFGAGYDNSEGDYSGQPHKGALMRFPSQDKSMPITFNGLKYANIAFNFPDVPAFLNQKYDNAAIYGQTNQFTMSGWENLGNNYKFTIPKGNLK